MSGMKAHHYKQYGRWLPTVMAEREHKLKLAEERYGKKEAKKKIEYPHSGDLSS